MITALYVVFAALLLGFITFKVIVLRRLHKISLGDGGINALQSAIAAHTNAVEIIPIGLLLLLTLELNTSNAMLIHIFGMMFLVSRGVHATAMLQENLKRRVLGMQLTIYTLLALIIANIIFLPFNQLLSF